MESVSWTGRVVCCGCGDGCECEAGGITGGSVSMGGDNGTARSTGASSIFTRSAMRTGQLLFEPLKDVPSV